MFQLLIFLMQSNDLLYVQNLSLFGLKMQNRKRCALLNVMLLSAVPIFVCRSCGSWIKFLLTLGRRCLGIKLLIIIRLNYYLTSPLTRIVTVTRTFLHRRVSGFHTRALVGSSVHTCKVLSFGSEVFGNPFFCGKSHSIPQSHLSDIKGGRSVSSCVFMLWLLRLRGSLGRGLGRCD
jgi:hypothetical protein